MKGSSLNGPLLLFVGLGLVIGCAGNGGSSLNSGPSGVVTGSSATTTTGGAAGYSFRAIGDMEGGQFWSSAAAVSDDGQIVVGTGYNSDGRHAWRWTEAQGFQVVTGFPGESDASSVSADGSTVFGWTTTNKVVTEAFAWDWFEGMTRLPGVPPGMYVREIGGCTADGKRAAALGSNSKGRQGLIWDSTSVYAVDASESQADYTRMCAISSDGNFAAGTKVSSLGTEAVLWVAGAGKMVLGDLSGGRLQSSVLGMSGDGSVVVGSGHSSSGQEAMRWSSSIGMVGMSDFTGGEFASQSRAASQDGTIIVGWGSDMHGKQAFLWTKNTGIEYLHRILENSGINLAGYRLESANGISRDGRTIVGSCINPRGQTEAFVATIP